MATHWNGATIVFESKAGANGSIAAEHVARATPDGYTWLIVTAFFTSSPALYNDLRWDPQRDFVPVGEICRAPNVFIVPASLPVKNVAEFVALAKSKPGMLTYGHPGKGTTGHLGFELFKKAADIDVTGVGYRGYPQMIPDISSGLVSSSFLSVNQVLSVVHTGSVRIIGTINENRTKYFPDVPTLAEQGVCQGSGDAVVRDRGAQGHAAADRREHRQGAGGLAGDGGRPRQARQGRLRGQERTPFGLRRRHQGRRGAVGAGGQGGRHHRGLGGFRGPPPGRRGRHYAAGKRGQDG
jgi:hypothetical protein